MVVEEGEISLLRFFLKVFLGLITFFEDFPSSLSTPMTP